jgi:capsular polysaccharide biosynthesis protein
MNEYENKIEFMEYLNVLWKRKWFIIIGTFLFLTAAAIISFLIPPIWEVDAIITPCKYIYKDADGTWQEMQFVSSGWIVNTVNQATFNEPIANELSLDPKDIEGLKAEKLRGTDQIRLSIREKDVDKSKLILNSLLNNIKNMCDLHADRRTKRFDSQIESKETEKSIIEEKITVYKEKLDSIKQIKKEVNIEMIDLRKKIEELKKEQHQILNKKNRSESESFTMLHYSNEIQQGLMNYYRLGEMLENRKIEEEIINLEIEDKERLINKIEYEIDDFNGKKLGIRYTQITKKPTSSLSPVSPNKLFNVIIAILLGFIAFTVLSYFIEYLEVQKSKNKK